MANRKCQQRMEVSEKEEKLYFWGVITEQNYCNIMPTHTKMSWDRNNILLQVYIPQNVAQIHCSSYASHLVWFLVGNEHIHCDNVKLKQTKTMGF